MTMFDRRTLLAAGGTLAALPAMAQAPADPRLGERSTGRADAPVTVQEFFSLTCPHCAAFHRETLPRVKTELVETGRIRMVWRDFPLDQIALRAAAVARSFPPASYDAFISALFGSQDRWAFARGIDHKAEVGKIAAVAGMAPAAFDAAWGDDELARGILALRQAAERDYNIQATPSFAFGRRVVSGAIAFDRFAREAQTP